jgi:hypothetical protein
MPTHLNASSCEHVSRKSRRALTLAWLGISAIYDDVAEDPHARAPPRLTRAQKARRQRLREARRVLRASSAAAGVNRTARLSAEGVRTAARASVLALPAALQVALARAQTQALRACRVRACLPERQMRVHALPHANPPLRLNALRLSCACAPAQAAPT